MTTRHTFRVITGIAAIAMATALGTGSAVAQPAGGPHGPGGPDAMFGHLFEHARTQLNLNTMQQQMFDQAVAGAKAAREAGRARAPQGPGRAAGRAGQDRTRSEGDRRGCGRREGPEPRTAAGGPRRMAGPLRHLQRRAEVGRARPLAAEARACRVLSASDARGNASSCRRRVRLERRHRRPDALQPADIACSRDRAGAAGIRWRVEARLRRRS